MLSNIIQCVFGIAGAIFDAFPSLLLIYKQLSDLRSQMIACILGIPVIAVSLGSFGIKAIVFFFKH